MYSQVRPLSDLECIKGRDTCLVCLILPKNVEVKGGHECLVYGDLCTSENIVSCDLFQCWFRKMCSEKPGPICSYISWKLLNEEKRRNGWWLVISSVETKYNELCKFPTPVHQFTFLKEWKMLWSQEYSRPFPNFGCSTKWWRNDGAPSLGLLPGTFWKGF